MALIKSSFLGVPNLREFAESIIVLFIVTVLSGIAGTIYAGRFPTWPEMVLVLHAGAIAAVGQIIRTFLKNNAGEWLKKDVPVVDLQEKLKTEIKILELKKDAA